MEYVREECTAEFLLYQSLTLARVLPVGEATFLTMSSMLATVRWTLCDQQYGHIGLLYGWGDILSEDHAKPFFDLVHVHNALCYGC